MVCHQHVGVDRTAGLAGVFLEPVQIEAIVFFGDEAGLAVIAPLDDVQWRIGQGHTWAAGHGDYEGEGGVSVGVKPWSVPYYSL